MGPILGEIKVVTILWSCWMDFSQKKCMKFGLVSYSDPCLEDDFPFSKEVILRFLSPLVLSGGWFTSGTNNPFNIHS